MVLKWVITKDRNPKIEYNDYILMDKTPTRALFTQHYISLAC